MRVPRAARRVVRVVPRHVAACQHAPTGMERWFVWTWKRENTGKKTRVPYSCNSWRCEVCRRHEAAVTFARLKEACSRPELDARGWCFLVVTLDRDGYFSGKPWADVNAAYRALGKMTRATLDRIGRQWGAETKLVSGGRAKQRRPVRTVGNRWIAVVEAHRSGWPHVNLLVWCPELAELLESEQLERLEDPEIANAVALARDAWKNREPLQERDRELARKATLVQGTVRELLEECGWGRQSTAERARDLEALLAYGVKMAGLHDSSIGEVAKITQAPLNAPVRFRRLRAGKGFLPPRRSDPTVTGCLMRRRRSREGDWELQSINAPKDDRQVVPIELARCAELALIAEEEQLLARNRGQLPAMPPLRIAYGGTLEPHRVTSERRAALQQRELAACG